MYPLKKGKTATQAHVGLPERDLRGRARAQRILRQIRASLPRAPTHRLDSLRRQAAAALLRSEPARADRLSAIRKACRVAFLGNQDVTLYVSRRSEPMPFYYRNADGDELIFVHRGEGTIETDFGPLRFRERATTSTSRAPSPIASFRETRDNFFLIIQSQDGIRPAGQRTARPARALRSGGRSPRRSPRRS